jgi:hypothetical protein
VRNPQKYTVYTLDEPLFVGQGGGDEAAVNERAAATAVAAAAAGGSAAGCHDSSRQQVRRCFGLPYVTH